MRLPDAEGFIAAAQIAINDHEVVYLHNAEGTIVAAIVDPELFKVHDISVSGRELVHDHIEPEMGWWE